MPYKFKGKRDCKQSDGTKGTYLTIKSDGSRTCYKGEKQYKASQAARHADAHHRDGDTLEEEESEDEEEEMEDELMTERLRRKIRRVIQENKIYNTFSVDAPMKMNSRADPEFAKLIKQRPIDEQWMPVQVIDESAIRAWIRKKLLEADLGSLVGGFEELSGIGATLGIGGGGDEETSIMDDASAMLSDMFPSAGEAEVDVEEIPEPAETAEAVQGSIGAHLMAKLKEKGAIGETEGEVDEAAVQSAIDELKDEIDQIAGSLKI